MDVTRFPIVEHLLITVIPWVVGIVVGGGAGAILALLARLLYSALPVLRKPMMLLPWRTAVMGLLALAWIPFLSVRMGIGPEFGGVTIGLVLLLLTLTASATILVEHWHPSGLVVRLTAAARTLGISRVTLWKKMKEMDREGKKS